MNLLRAVAEKDAAHSRKIGSAPDGDPQHEGASRQLRASLVQDFARQQRITITGAAWRGKDRKVAAGQRHLDEIAQESVKWPVILAAGGRGHVANACSRRRQAMVWWRPGHHELLQGRKERGPFSKDGDGEPLAVAAMPRGRWVCFGHLWRLLGDSGGE